jgi:uncharacterized protein (DUF1330 family)
VPAVPAYILGSIEVDDPDGYAEYAARVPATVEQYGGRYLARGGRTEALEGPTPAGRQVVLRFDSVEAARRWYASPEYSAIRPIRERCSRGTLLLTDGLPDAP